MEFLKREWVGGLSVILAIATLAGTDFRFTPFVLVLLTFGGLWTAVVAYGSLRGRRMGPGERPPLRAGPSSLEPFPAARAEAQRLVQEELAKEKEKEKRTRAAVESLARAMVRNALPLRPKPAEAESQELVQPISVRIDRDPEWSNFEYRAWILKLHVVVTNNTDSDKQIQDFIWKGNRAAIMADVEVARYVAQQTATLAPLKRHHVLEPRVPNSGWMVQAFPWTGDGVPPVFSLFVRVEGVEYEAIR